ncbi:adenylosuccinate lyase [Wigglesworthia glossinidia endosymbiont of Glossina morsitans morsitans (Yale colony)]|uniref:Adenylosuccinate lyase n=1 Tax=Wigglesworthia glossinidia endosymbiont of Glossina morsitans morsitans (Yale colony) TaxID=1142511 RepID=H6Q5R4_WIGGL|nr:adenylosuccinate lyase [Wigglesworthia glossinidia]AFA40969.1 adenylosuccinate lyase [Wigglesworthia glossinidia endosymbiont of Glossina morsitans morsitans (Yale colony)]
MHISSLTAISPIEGRYYNYTVPLRSIFSEFALLKFRLKIEIKWFESLAECDEILELQPLNNIEKRFIKNIISNFSFKDAERIKEIEFKTKHDIKSLEYFLKEKFSLLISLKEKSEFIHFACTSEDINNLAYGLILSRARKKFILPIWKKIVRTIYLFSMKYDSISILSRTHGQPATPSTFGKEMLNFYYRMTQQYQKLKKIKILGKFNGTVGNYNAHNIAYPNFDWVNFSKKFISNFDIVPNVFTTQIEPHDYIVEILNCISHFNSILIGFNQDIWTYVSRNYFKKKFHVNEIGSSVMPHKVNPIDFENSEGNLELSNAILNFLSKKLPISRLQRDLTDSTILRNIGVAISYSFIAYQKMLYGFSKLEINTSKIKNDLNNHWEVLSEPIQILMRRNKIKNSYELVKNFFKKHEINEINIKLFIKTLNISETDKKILQNITPDKYIGLSTQLIRQFKKYIK